MDFWSSSVSFLEQSREKILGVDVPLALLVAPFAESIRRACDDVYYNIDIMLAVVFSSVENNLKSFVLGIIRESTDPNIGY